MVVVFVISSRQWIFIPRRVRTCDDGRERDLCMQKFPTGQLFPTSDHARRGEEDQPAAKRLRTRRTSYIIFTMLRTAFGFDILISILTH